MNLPYAYDEKIETDLKIALEMEQFRLYYQPKINVISGEIIGVEALIRWEHPEKGVISPLDFIPVAEATGLILPIGEWVLREACKQNKMWQEEGLTPFIMAVNLSVRQLHQSDLVQVVEDVLVETELAPEYLELEITESMMMNVQRVLPVVKELKKLGVRLSLDDFGTGYSSLNYLKEFPIDEIKIDQSFIRFCISDKKNATIVKAIIAMAHQLQLDVVAEGVETKEQLVFLQQHLCNKAQGYLFSKPVLPDELIANFKEIEKVTKREGIPQELSKQKQLEEALANARQELQDTVRQQQGMIFKFTERDGKFIHTLCDGELLYKIGITPQNLIGKELYEVLPFEEAKRKSYYYRRAWKGEDINYEGKLNGVWYLASLRPIRRAGQVVEVIASCVDITERIEIEERFQKIVEYSLTGIIIYRDGRILYANQSALKILKEEKMEGELITSFLYNDFPIPIFSEQVLLEGEFGKDLPTSEVKIKRSDGAVIDIEAAEVSINYDGSPAFLALFKDETKRKFAERTFERSIKKFEDIEYALNESSVVAITNQKGIIEFVNDKFCEISKYTREELVGQDHKILNSGHHPKKFFKEMWRTIGQGKTWSKEIRNKAKDGSFYWVHTTIVPFLNDRGMPYQYVSIRTDITKRKRMEEALRVNEERYRLITNNMTDLVSLIGFNGFFKYASPSHTTLLGYPIEVFERKNIEDLIHSNDQKQVWMNFEKMIELKEDCIFEFRCKDIVGNWMWLEAKATPIFDAEGRFDHFLIVSREISERKMYEEKLTHMAYHDTLTDLPNRRLFLIKLKESLEEAERHKRKMAVLYIDMDGFKKINDTYGHDVGDEILKQFVEIVQAHLHENITFSRQGGDEFTILMPEIQGGKDAIDIANCIVKSLRTYRNKDHPLLKMSASLGISLYPQDGETAQKLMEYADKALYKVKKDGKNNFRTYS